MRFRGERLVSIKYAFLAVNVVTINMRFRGERLVSIKCAFLAVNVSISWMCVSPIYFICSTKLRTDTGQIIEALLVYTDKSGDSNSNHYCESIVKKMRTIFCLLLITISVSYAQLSNLRKSGNSNCVIFL
jgi:hypothetical protein